MNNNTFMSFYLKDTQMRISTKALRDIGMPYYVRFLVNPQTNQMIMQAYDKKELTSFKVARKVFIDSKYHSFRIASKQFCTAVTHQLHWDMNRSYRVPGVIYSKQNLVQFDLSAAFLHESDSDD